MEQLTEKTKVLNSSRKTVEYYVEFINQNDISGLLIECLGEDGGLLEVFFLPCDMSDIEEWIFRYGSEDEDYRVEQEWFDSEGGNGWYYPVKYVIEDSLESNMKEYAISNKPSWVQGQ
jgi:hypothetical protein